MTPARLPHVDDLSTVAAAGPDAVWRALLAHLDDGLRRPAAARYARLVGCDPHRPAGPRPLAAGSELPGFRVVEAVPPERLVLEGRHRFSEYRLAFTVQDDGAGRTRLTAGTHARFPGPTGAAYRLLVLRTGGHVLAVRRLLDGVRRRAERG